MAALSAAWERRSYCSIPPNLSGGVCAWSASPSFSWAGWRLSSPWWRWCWFTRNANPRIRDPGGKTRWSTESTYEATRTAMETVWETWMVILLITVIMDTIYFAVNYLRKEYPKVEFLDHLLVIHERLSIKHWVNVYVRHTYGVWYSVSILLSNIPFILFFPGVVSKLDYIKDLGVGVISLSPDYEDDGSNGDFHIKNHMKIGGSVGGDDALQRLITQAHGKGSIDLCSQNSSLWF